MRFILNLKGVLHAYFTYSQCPEDLYQQIQRLAEARSRSLSAQVVTMLTQALEEEQNRKAQALQRD